MKTNVAPNAFFENDKMAANISAQLEFIVGNESAIIIDIINADVEINATLSDFIFNI